MHLYVIFCPKCYKDEEIKFLTSNEYYIMLNVRFGTYADHEECETLKSKFNDYEGIYEFSLCLKGILEELIN